MLVRRDIVCEVVNFQADKMGVSAPAKNRQRERETERKRERQRETERQRDRETETGYSCQMTVR